LDDALCVAGETEEQHKELVQFCKTFRFERMGAFAYSEEDGTPAASLAEQVSPCNSHDARCYVEWGGRHHQAVISSIASQSDQDLSPKGLCTQIWKEIVWQNLLRRCARESRVKTITLVEAVCHKL